MQSMENLDGWDGPPPEFSTPPRNRAAGDPFLSNFFFYII